MQIIFPANTSQLCQAIVRRAQLDIPILENPYGSNRSPEIDAMCRRWGVPLGSYWCALWAATVWQDAGAQVPPITDSTGQHPALCQTWYEWARNTGRFTHKPGMGYAPLYGTPAHAEHIGACVVSLVPLVMDFEGNTSITGYSRQGELTGLKVVDATRLIGFVSPEPLTQIT